MRRRIERDLSELLTAGVISEDIAAGIRDYYERNSAGTGGRLMLVFAVLGTLLVGLGIVLIVAHNWDTFPKFVKLTVALLPLLMGQLVCAYAMRSDKSVVWQESSAVFLFCSIAAAMAIVSQVYHVPGSLADFLFTWMLLSIPVVYFMRSAVTSLLVIAGLTVYACQLSYFHYPTSVAWFYWPMLASLLPFVMQIRRARRNAFVATHYWFIGVSLVISLGMFDRGPGTWTLVAYMALFCLMVVMGMRQTVESDRVHALYLIGHAGTAFMLIILSFADIWTEVARNWGADNLMLYVAVTLAALAIVALAHEVRHNGIRQETAAAFVFPLFLVLYVIGHSVPSLAMWIVNLLVLVLAAAITWWGIERNHIGILNYGLLWMTALILCRFFDTDMTFVLRGILFMSVGAAFLGVNYWVLRRRRAVSRNA